MFSSCQDMRVITDWIDVICGKTFFRFFHTVIDGSQVSSAITLETVKNENVR